MRQRINIMTSPKDETTPKALRDTRIAPPDEEEYRFGAADEEPEEVESEDE
jgi:hypothetical protein